MATKKKYKHYRDLERGDTFYLNGFYAIVDKNYPVTSNVNRLRVRDLNGPHTAHTLYNLDDPTAKARVSRFHKPLFPGSRNDILNNGRIPHRPKNATYDHNIIDHED